MEYEQGVRLPQCLHNYLRGRRYPKSSRLDPITFLLHQDIVVEEGCLEHLGPYARTLVGGSLRITKVCAKGRCLTTECQKKNRVLWS